jgi:hypothetical protein
MQFSLETAGFTDPSCRLGSIGCNFDRPHPGIFARLRTLLEFLVDFGQGCT